MTAEKWESVEVQNGTEGNGKSDRNPRQHPLVAATEVPASTEFKVDDTVGHSDQYMTAYTYHGIVEEVVGDDILVRWVERQGKHNEYEKYHTSELRRLE